MAIIQISKIQVRTGDLVDLPQLDEGEFGWASDQKKLYIGKTTPNENIEVLTSYSSIDFSQINGGYGNLDIITPLMGQVLAYNASANAWVNAGGNAQDPGNSSYYNGESVHLGNVSNVYIGGGAIGYVLETDGTGNLSWTPKGTISANITAASKTNPVVITTDVDNFFTDGMKVTITNVGGMVELNGNSYYANILTSNTFSLYSDTGLTTPVNGTGYTTYTSGGRVIASVSGSGGGGAAGGSTYSMQYNSGGISTGDSNITWDFNNRILSVQGSETVSGNAVVGNLSTAGQIVSTVATGTAPLTVTSTTRVANLSVAYSNVSDFGVVTAQTTGIFYPAFVNGSTTANRALGANANLSFDAATGTLTATRLSATGNANVGNLGTTGVFATTLSSTGNANVGNLGTGGLITATGNITGGNIITAGIMSSTGNATHGNIITGGLITATGNIQSTAFLIAANLSISGNANVGNIGAVLHVGNLSGTGNSNVGNLGATGVFATTLSASGNANVGNLGTTGVFATTLSATGNANVGNIGATNIVGTLTSASQTNITAVGTLVNLSVSGTATIGNIQSAVLTTGSNVTAGTITGNWSLSTGSRLQATYADLAEYYNADQYYPPGTVLEFGGVNEVTIATDGTNRIAGVVSTDPAYAMNAKCPGEHPLPIALIGRVPTKVRGTIRKGDMMVSAGNGYARPSNNPTIGSVIGKSLENFDGVEGVIEIVVGRL